jgi:hypothetical protein
MNHSHGIGAFGTYAIMGVIFYKSAISIQESIKFLKQDNLKQDNEKATEHANSLLEWLIPSRSVVIGVVVLFALSIWALKSRASELDQIKLGMTCEKVVLCVSILDY